MKSYIIFLYSVLCACICAVQLNAQFGELPSAPQFNEDYMRQFAFDEEGPVHGDDSEEADSGNWYEKLHWWKEAKRVYTIDIHEAMEQLKGVTQHYEEKKKTVLARLSSLQSSLPVDPKTALGIVTTTLAEIKAKQEQVAVPQTDEQRKTASDLAEQEKALEALKTNFEHLQTLDARLKEALNDAYPKQVKECENYEEKALDYFERIEKVLDDKKAHQYYDIIENSLENIRSLISYLNGQLYQFIEQSSAMVEQLVPRIKKELEDLEKKGIRIRLLTEAEKAELAAVEKQKKEARLKAEAEKKAKEAWEKLPWWRKALAGIGSFFASIWSAIVGFFSSIGSAVGSFFGGGGGKAVPPVVKKP